MEIKKKSNVNLEKFKSLFLLFGLAMTLGLMLFAFNWTSKAEKISDLGSVDLTVDEEITQITRQDITPPPPPEQPKVAEVLNIVDDEEELENEMEVEDFEADDETEIEIIEVEEDEEEENTIFVIVEQMPAFPGGDLALKKWIAKNVNYPAVARENDIQGKVYIRFEVTKTGGVDKVSIVRGVDPILDREAVRVIKKLPKFNPGKQRGKPVSVWYTVPINFKLS